MRFAPAVALPVRIRSHFDAQDVLENGEASVHAETFDIEWNPPAPELAGQVLLPVLGDQYGRVLERGELRLERDGGQFFLRYYDRRFPLSPRSLSCWRLRHCSSSQVLNTSHVVNRGIGTMKLRRA